MKRKVNFIKSKLYYNTQYQTEFDSLILKQEKRSEKIMLYYQAVFYLGGVVRSCEWKKLSGIAVEDAEE